MTVKIVSDNDPSLGPEAPAYHVKSSHRTEAAAIRAARKLAGAFVIAVPECRLFGAVWHVAVPAEG